jgi:hypothetical protein
MSALLAAERIGAARAVGCLLALPFLGAVAAAWRYLQRPVSSRSQLFEPVSALWVLLTYLGLGALPHLLPLGR